MLILNSKENEIQNIIYLSISRKQTMLLVTL